jgi:DNA-binding transcriptional LysR family regulator
MFDILCMMDFDISTLNLNLLPALDALLAERSVSGAARRMGVSQSAMSHTLARLRDELDDPLLVLSGRRMLPTPHALALAGPLSEALHALEAALSPRHHFDPAVDERRFKIATYDLFELSMLPQLLAFLASNAPRITLRVERVTERTPARLQRGDIDLVLASETLELPSSGLMRRRLAAEGFSVVARQGRFDGRLTLRRYLASEHILVSLEGKSQGVVDRALRRNNQGRRVALTVPHFMSALALAAGSDSVLTLPTSAARRGAELFDLCVFAPPLRLPRVAAQMVWPTHLAEDEGHRWLRTVLTRED